MSAAILRLLACALMLADHIGGLFFPDEPVLRLVGRMAFPIFAFLVAQGCKLTRSPNRYVSRLALLGAVSQLPFSLAFPDSYTRGNVVLTLLAGALVCLSPSKRHGWMLLAMAGVAEAFRLDYGAAGVLAVYVFWWVGESKGHRIAAFVAVGLLTALRYGVLAPFQGMSFRSGFVPQAFAIVAAAVALVYDGTAGSRWRGFFYLFYPVHLLILAVVVALMAGRL